MSAKIITIGGSKGGVGKSTSAVNVGLLAAENDYQVLIVDIDEQGSTSKFFASMDDLKTQNFHSSKLFRPDIDLKPMKVSDNISLIRADFDNNSIEDVQHSEIEHYLSIFRRNIHKLAQDYDLIIFDSPGKKYAIRAKSSLICSDAVLLPFLLSKVETDEIHPFIHETVLPAQRYNRKLEWYLLPRAKGVKYENGVGVPARSKSKDLFEKLLKSLGGSDKVLPLIGDREAFQSVLDDKVPLWKTNSDGKKVAVQELKNYTKAIFKKIGLTRKATTEVFN